MLEVQGHNVIVGIDRSGSMDTRDCEGQTRYSYLAEKLATFVAAACTTAANSQVTGLFFSDNVKQFIFKSDTDAKNAMASIRPAGGTATEKVIEAAFNLAQSNPGTPTMFFLVTDGHPNEEALVDKEIISITKCMSKPEDFRIMLLTVGNRDAHLTQWLEHLDSDLGPAGAAFDIVGQNNLMDVDFREAAAELIASSTTNDEALAGATGGKTTTRID